MWRAPYLEVELVALAANRSAEALVALAREFPTVRRIALADASCRYLPCMGDLPAGCAASFGREAVDELAELQGVDCVSCHARGVLRMQGAATGALASGRELALANKESLVVAGDLIMPLASRACYWPVHSEHSAIFQCFLGEDPWRARRHPAHRLGRPVLWPHPEELAEVTAADALRHPNWSMGPKVTTDSSTLMNKGLEAIEAHHLFDAPFSMIRIVVQRQGRRALDGRVRRRVGAGPIRGPPICACQSSTR